MRLNFRAFIVFLLLFPRLLWAAENVSCPHGQKDPDSYIVRLRSSNRNEQTNKGSLSAKSSPSHQSEKFDKLGLSFRWIRAPKKSHAVSARSQNESFQPATTAVVQANAAQIRELKSSPEVISIEPDCLVKLNTLPNDPGQPDQWAHRLVHLPEAWNISHDAKDVIVAISDTGVEYRHEDLANNLWLNQAEANGIPDVDDDGNGCIDDYYGCDFADGDGDPLPSATAIGSHGTHVAGIVGAAGNNSLGVSGAAWRVKLLAVKAFSSLDDSASMSDLLKSIYYSTDQGARIINCSWGIGRAPTPAEVDAFQYALSRGALPIVAAGNESVDAANSSPAAIPGVVTVGSVNSNREMSGFSNFGAVVGVYAPGGDSIAKGGRFDEYILSTLPSLRGVYGSLRGTSMSAPLVSGIAALILSVNPTLLPSEVIQVIQNTSDQVTTQTPTGIKAQIRIINAEKALLEAQTRSTLIRKPACTGSTDSCEQNALTEEPPPQLQTGSSTSSSAGGCSPSLRMTSHWRVLNTPDPVRAQGFQISWLVTLLFGLPGVLFAVMRWLSRGE